MSNQDARQWTVLMLAAGGTQALQVAGSILSAAPSLLGNGARYIETVRPLGLAMVPGFLLAVDEDGIGHEQPENSLASYLYGSHLHGYVIFGNAFIVREMMTDEGPDAFWLTEDEANDLQARLKIVEHPDEGRMYA